MSIVSEMDGTWRRARYGMNEENSQSSVAPVYEGWMTTCYVLTMRLVVWWDLRRPWMR